MCTQCTQSHSTCDADLCCADTAVHAIRGWNWGVLSHALPVMLTYVVQVSLYMPSADGTEMYLAMQYTWFWPMLCRYNCVCHQRMELRCTQLHSTPDAHFCCAGIAVCAVRGWNWSVLSHTVLRLGAGCSGIISGQASQPVSTSVCFCSCYSLISVWLLTLPVSAFTLI